MKPAQFDYVRAADLAEALDVLHREGAQARVLAGGQSLLPMLNMRLARPSVVVDVMRIAALGKIVDNDRTLEIGAGVRQAALLGRPGLGRRHPMLAAALPWVGHAQTRSRGTICGSVAHADPSAEIPLCLLTLGGKVHLRSARRARVLPADAFFAGMMATARADDELIEAISIPAAPAGSGQAFREIGRRHGDFAIVACAALAGRDGVRLGIGGVADRPMLAELPPPDAGGFAAALEAFAWSLDARDDLHATAAYRRELVRQLGRQTIEEAVRCRA